MCIRSLRDTEHAVAGIAKPRHDVSRVVELFVDDGQKERHRLVGAGFGHGSNTLWRGHQTHAGDLGCALGECDINAGDQRATGGQHRVELENVSPGCVVRKALGIDLRNERLLVALEPQKAAVGGGNELEKAVQHAQAGT